MAEAHIDSSVARDSEVSAALSGKADTAHQHSGADINSGTMEADRVEDGAGSNLNADQLDGKDSEEILPLVRAQKDPNQGLNSNAQTSPSLDINTVSITAPTNGILVIWGSTALGDDSTETQTFLVSPKVDGNFTASRELVILDGSSSAEHASMNTVVPVSAGTHTVTLNVARTVGSGNWRYNRHNLAVMFVPAERGQVTDAAN